MPFECGKIFVGSIYPEEVLIPVQLKTVMTDKFFGDLRRQLSGEMKMQLVSLSNGTTIIGITADKTDVGVAASFFSEKACEEERKEEAIKATSRSAAEEDEGEGEEGEEDEGEEEPDWFQRLMGRS